VREALLPALITFAASWVLTGWVLRYALRNSMLDLPNPRGSHSTATPRGGGLAIAIAVLAGIGASGGAGWISREVAAALLGGGVMVAVIGWLDDRRGVSVGVRLAVHFAAAGWAIWWLGGVSALGAGGSAVQLGVFGPVVGLLGIAWATNCYNFMDGSDGLAGAEAVTVGVVGALFLFASGNAELGLVALLIAGAAAGFVIWNWSPARIFMGDVGSGLLGFLFAVLALASEGSGALPVLAWILLLGVFGFDATVTLLWRMWRGEHWYQAHRTHAYQRAIQRGWSHAQVARAVVLLDLGLAALVWGAWRWPSLWLPAVIAAVVGLAVLYVRVQEMGSIPLDTTGVRSR